MQLSHIISNCFTNSCYSPERGKGPAHPFTQVFQSWVTSWAEAPHPGQLWWRGCPEHSVRQSNTLDPGPSHLPGAVSVERAEVIGAMKLVYTIPLQGSDPNDLPSTVEFSGQLSLPDS